MKEAIRYDTYNFLDLHIRSIKEKMLTHSFAIWTRVISIALFRSKNFLTDELFFFSFSLRVFIRIIEMFDALLKRIMKETIN